MLTIIQTINEYEYVTCFSQNFNTALSQNFNTALLQNLNPALFQNIILAILAIFIPFAIVFFNKSLNQEEARNYFDKLVLNREVLSIRAVFWSSIIALFVLSFFESGHNDLSDFLKIISIIIFTIVFLFLLQSFRKILKYIESGKEKFEIDFLKKQEINDGLIKIWESYFSKKYENEYLHITEFIKHIDKAIKEKKIEIAHRLANLYIDTSEKRETFVMYKVVFQKLLELNEKIEIENKNTTYEGYIEPLDLSKIVEILEKKKHGVENKIHNYIATCIEKYEKYDKLDKDKCEKYNRYIQQTLNKCLIPIFNNVNSRYEFSVDESWQITSKNKGDMMPFFVLNAFIQWAKNFRGKIIDTELSNHEWQFSNVVNTLFPTIETNTFSYFLKLYFNVDGYDEKGILDITKAVEDNYNIYSSSAHLWFESDEERMIKEMEEQGKNEISELINIIFHYFYNWDILQINGYDITEYEKKNWKSLTPQDKQNIQVRKMENFKQAFEKYAKDKNEPNKVIPFIRLIDLLIERLKKPIDK